VDKVPKKKIVSFNITHAVFSLLVLLALEDKSNGFYQNPSKELSLCSGDLTRRLGDASLGLAPHGLVQSSLVVVHT
jgi:hypothetical protein